MNYKNLIGITIYNYISVLSQMQLNLISKTLQSKMSRTGSVTAHLFESISKEDFDISLDN